MNQVTSILGKLPAIGRRSAERIAIKLLSDPMHTLLKKLVATLDQADTNLRCCSVCCMITPITEDPCRFCADPRRDDSILCVVEDAGDLMLVEKSGGFIGRYHILNGRLSPMKGDGPHNLRFQALLQRIGNGSFREVIIALNADVESDATASYLHDLLTPYNIKLTRLATGVPVGSGLAYSDPVTIKQAIAGRWDVGH